MKMFMFLQKEELNQLLKVNKMINNIKIIIHIMDYLILHILKI